MEGENRNPFLFSEMCLKQTYDLAPDNEAKYASLIRMRENDTGEDGNDDEEEEEGSEGGALGLSK